jgi:hypothetical protein
VSPRAKQLLLEVLLLSERYSDKDIAWVRNQLADNTQATQIMDLFVKPLQQSEIGASKRNVNDPIDLKSKKTALVESLLKSRSNHGLRRAENIAQRLNIKLSGQAHQELVREIDNKLSKMDDRQLSRFLRPYKTIAEVDDAYIGLANTLMRPSHED